MWILLRLLLAAAGLVIRQLALRGRRGDNGTIDGTPYRTIIDKRKGEVLSFQLSMERETPTWIRMHVESAVDRAFKAMGIANEQQTGDATFDDRVYVTCDHPHVATVLRESAELRAAILALFDAGFSKIFFDGKFVRVYNTTKRYARDADARLLKTLWEASWRLSDAPPSRFSDPFLWKALLVEGVIWSIAGYAIGAGIELAFANADQHVERGALWMTGLITAATAFGGLLLLIALWLRGSSRGHRVIVESAIVLLFALPTASVQIVSDTNRSLDHAQPTIVERSYMDCEVREHRRKRRTTYTYHLRLVTTAEGPALPDEIETERDLCTAANNASDHVVTIAIGRGRWGLRWYRWIRIGETTWTSPT